MKAKLIQLALQIMLSLLSPELLKTFADKLFDMIEEFVSDTENDVDDALVLPLIGLLREAFDIPDNDE